MRGGTSCGAGGSCASGSCGGSAVTETSPSADMTGSGPGAYNDGNFSWDGESAPVAGAGQSGGSHCYPTHMKTPKRRGRGRERRSKGRKLRGGSCPVGQCGGA